jgi:hypothetical protein
MSHRLRGKSSPAASFDIFNEVNLSAQCLEFFQNGCRLLPARQCACPSGGWRKRASFMKCIANTGELEGYTCVLSLSAKHDRMNMLLSKTSDKM